MPIRELVVCSRPIGTRGVVLLNPVVEVGELGKSLVEVIDVGVDLSPLGNILEIS